MSDIEAKDAIRLYGYTHNKEAEGREREGQR